MKVSVIIANRNDVEMLGITVRSAIEELSAVPGGGEVIVVDNSDKEIAEVMPAILPAGYRRGKNPKIRYFRQDYPCLFTARQKAAEEATGDYLFCVDSHCIIGHNVIVDLVHFLNRNKSKRIGFAHAPVNWLCQWEGAARHDMKEIHGTWGRLYDYETKISWKGMPWMCRRDWFLKRLNGYGALAENRLAWGGGDMHLGLKTWLLGYENWAVPTRPVIHIGPLPTIARKFCKYRRYSKSGEGMPGMGYLVSLFAMGADVLAYDQTFSNFINDRHGLDVAGQAEHAKGLAKNEYDFIKKNKVIEFSEMWANPPWKKPRGFSEIRKDFSKNIGDIQRSIKKEDWQLIEGIIRKHKVKSVVEFGIGLSTLMLQEIGMKLTSIESDGNFFSAMQPLLQDGCDLRLWDNESEINFNEGRYDLAIIDGALPRLKQAEIAASIADMVLVHDGHKRQCGYRAALKFSEWTEIKNKTRLSRVFVR